MAPTDIIEASTDNIYRHGVESPPGEAGNGEQDEKPFPFLSFPGEIRDSIYHQLLSLHHSEREDNRLYEQPAITRVNRRLRAEALPLYYASSIVLRVKAESPEDWTPFIQRVVDVFTGGPVGSPGSSTMRLLGGIHLDFFLRQDGYHIEADLVADPDVLKAPATGRPLGPREKIGSAAMNWADATALRAACDEAVVRLEDDLMETLMGKRFRGQSFKPLNIFNQRAALDALCAFASACPHLTHALVRVNVDREDSEEEEEEEELHRSNCRCPFR
ncbi:hypothetical protein INS49_014368 [Diaporthe citri]|uniref:uncharacterized protein n=1 Tax=Diaporthe citri TaxID=83186 RepID=UPI001C7F15B4|nr:uncharacterized protein INS49_014368 [Diaporthe citri]KAG6358484.1 hypothetical protein INS49_014368 [Diaporthe citri]